MLTCLEVVDFLMAYLDNELSAEERVRFEEHLAVCPPCVAFLETYRQSVALCQHEHHQGVEATSSTSLPESLVQAILQSQAGQPPRDF